MPPAAEAGDYRGARDIDEEGQRQFRDAILAGHNRVRAAVQVPPLQWSAALEAQARARAAAIARDGFVQEAPPPDGGRESLYFGRSEISPAEAARHCCQLFERQGQRYVPGTPYDPYTMPQMEQFMAMVWQSTTSLGAAICYGPKNIIIVCRYLPGGRMAGRLPYGQESPKRSPGDAKRRARSQPTPTRRPAPPSFRDAVLAGHNFIRRSVHLSPLVWHPLLEVRARSLVSVLAEKDRLDPGDFSADWEGECLYWSSAASLAPHEAAEQCCQTFDAEARAQAREGHETDQPNYSHIVWKGTTSMGAATATGPRGTYVLCLYLPQRTRATHRSPRRGSASPSPQKAGAKRSHSQPASSPQKKGTFRDTMLAEHNRMRALVHLPPLQWDPELEAHAKDYARVLAQLGKSQHSDPADRPGQGENLCRNWGTSMHPVDVARETCESFEEERQHYAPGMTVKQGNVHAIGHYTQIVWQETERMGAAFAVGQQGGIFVVCRYTPAGNRVGVLPYGRPVTPPGHSPSRSSPTHHHAGSPSRSRSQPAARHVSSRTFKEVMVAEHNRARQRVGVPPLQWSAQLETQAKAYARTLAQRGELASSGALERPNQGENLFACPATTMLPEEVAAECCRAFVAEGHDYVPGTPIARSGGPRCLNYTQLVWAASTIFAAAMAVGPEGTFVVCRYFPAGNQLGQAPYDVPGLANPAPPAEASRSARAPRSAVRDAPRDAPAAASFRLAPKPADPAPREPELKLERIPTPKALTSVRSFRASRPAPSAVSFSPQASPARSSSLGPPAVSRVEHVPYEVDVSTDRPLTPRTLGKLTTPTSTRSTASAPPIVFPQRREEPEDDPGRPLGPAAAVPWGDPRRGLSDPRRVGDLYGQPLTGFGHPDVPALQYYTRPIWSNQGSTPTFAYQLSPRTNGVSDPRDRFSDPPPMAAAAMPTPLSLEYAARRSRHVAAPRAAPLGPGDPGGAFDYGTGSPGRSPELGRRSHSLTPAYSPGRWAPPLPTSGDYRLGRPTDGDGWRGPATPLGRPTYAF
eukprot:EG_transcript_1418